MRKERIQRLFTITDSSGGIGPAAAAAAAAPQWPYSTVAVDEDEDEEEDGNNAQEWMARELLSLVVRWTSAWQSVVHSVDIRD